MVPWIRYSDLREKEIFERISKSKICFVCDDCFNYLLDIQKDSSKPWTRNQLLHLPWLHFKTQSDFGCPPIPGPMCHSHEKVGPHMLTGRVWPGDMDPGLCGNGKQDHSIYLRYPPWESILLKILRRQWYFHRNISTDKLWIWVKYLHRF